MHPISKITLKASFMTAGAEIIMWPLYNKFLFLMTFCYVSETQNYIKIDRI